jgi:cupin fold WbuC family metalloprotein
MKNYRRANSLGGTMIVTQSDINDTLTHVSDTVRAREAITIHDSFSEIPQRFVNCFHSNSYIRPHMHPNPNHWELTSWISGEFIVLIFNNHGVVMDKFVMNEYNVRIIEIKPMCYHTYIATKPSAFIEVCNSNYDINHININRVYSDWSPAETDNSLVANYLKLLYNAQIGEAITI